MECGKWVWFFALCRFYVCAQEKAYEQLNFTDCWNFGRHKSILQAPVFSAADGENLSFKECGLWQDANLVNLHPPWRVFLEHDSDFYKADLVSDHTIISLVSFSYNIFKEGKEIQVFGGDCVREKDEKICNDGRGMLVNKVLDVKKAEVKYGRFFSFPIYVWRVQKLQLTPSLRPVCLWNDSNRNDAKETFYYDGWVGRQLNRTDFLDEKQCFGRSIKKWECDMFGNTICTSNTHGDIPNYLYIRRAGRFFLRALGTHFVTTETKTWFDILPATKQIVAASADLTLMPEIPRARRRIDFGTSQSFWCCGQKSRVRRRPERDDAKLPGTAFIVGGHTVQVKGRHPWHASLSHDALDDFCGATLISKRTLVTAAHCLFMDGSEVKASKLVVKLGMHSKFKADENSRQNNLASSFVVHPGYNHLRGDFKDDIALIVLRDEAKFTDFVMPICLWNENYDLKRIANRTGTVVGWGYTSDHQQPDILEEAQIKVVSYEECYESSRLFFSVNMRPRENFCAGFPQNRSGACNGDSGGGFVMKSEGRFFLRGVVSSGRSREVAAEGGARVVTCNPKYLALFTDVTNFMGWIVRNTPDFPPLPPAPENHPETSERPATSNTTKTTKFPPQTFWDGLFSLILQHFDLKTIN